MPPFAAWRGGILGFLCFIFLHLFQLRRQIITALDLAGVLEADYVRFAASARHGGHFVDEIHRCLDFFFPCLPFAPKEFCRHFRVVVTALRIKVASFRFSIFLMSASIFSFSVTGFSAAQRALGAAVATTRSRVAEMIFDVFMFAGREECSI